MSDSAVPSVRFGGGGRQEPRPTGTGMVRILLPASVKARRRVGIVDTEPITVETSRTGVGEVVGDDEQPVSNPAGSLPVVFGSTCQLARG